MYVDLLGFLDVIICSILGFCNVRVLLLHSDYSETMPISPDLLRWWALDRPASRP
jgi:hypothetical protein